MAYRIVLVCSIAGSALLSVLLSSRAVAQTETGDSVPEKTATQQNADPVARWTSENDGNGLEFDGNSVVTFKTKARDEPGPFTVSVWVNAFDLNGADPTYGRGVARSTSNGRIGDWILSVHRDGRVRFINWRTAGTDATGSHITVDPVIGLDYWAHLAAVWDGKQNRIFVNGVLQKHSKATSASGWGNGNEIGRSWTTPAYHWQGKIEDFALYDRPLDPKEIASLFSSNAKSKPEPEPDVVPAGDTLVTQVLDDFIDDRLKADSLEPAPDCSDAEFHRRVMLDLAGRIPTPDETRAFLASNAADRRTALIDRLLSSREMPIYWSRVLAGWLMNGSDRRNEKFVSYLRRGLLRKKGWDAFARDMLLARPAAEDQQATLFLSTRADQIAAGTIGLDVGRAFFGVNLRCAQCHDHPAVPEWRQEHVYGLAAFFTRSFAATWKNKDNLAVPVIGEYAAGEVEFTPLGDERQPAPLLFLDGTIVEEPPADETEAAAPQKPAASKPIVLKAPPAVPKFSRRAAFVEVAFDPQRPYVQQAMVNRVWKKLMGRGLVEPVDMIHQDNPPSHPELFDALARDSAGHGYDLRRLIAVIMKSRTYARSSRWSDGPSPDESLYAVALPKPLDEHQLGLSIPMAVGYYDQQLSLRPGRSMRDLRPVASWTQIIDQFEARSEADQTTTGQALFLLNSEYFQNELLGRSRLADSMAGSEEPGQLAELVYVKVLSRFPTTDESQSLGEYLNARGANTRTAACREILWALLTSPEFRFNH